jgi:hypothetical protein
MKRFDLHTHSRYSDGTHTPTELVAAAAKAGISLLALTDHDTMNGTAEALQAGKNAGITVLAGVEFDCAWPQELHILGLGLDMEGPALLEALHAANLRREARNEAMILQLLDAGYDVRPYLGTSEGSLTRLHVALAMKDAGYVDSARAAFDTFLRPGQIGSVAGYRESCIAPAEAIRVIREAGGLAVWAHPMNVAANPHSMTRMLAAEGLGGIEAFHPSATEGEAALLLSLAAQHNLFVTCGSDCHGANRPSVTLGCTWRDCAPLEKTYAYFVEN